MLSDLLNFILGLLPFAFATLGCLLVVKLLPELIGEQLRGLILLFFIVLVVLGTKEPLLLGQQEREVMKLAHRLLVMVPSLHAVASAHSACLSVTLDDTVARLVVAEVVVDHILNQQVLVARSVLSIREDRGERTRGAHERGVGLVAGVGHFRALRRQGSCGRFKGLGNKVRQIRPGGDHFVVIEVEERRLVGLALVEVRLVAFEVGRGRGRVLRAT